MSSRAVAVALVAALGGCLAACEEPPVDLDEDQPATERGLDRQAPDPRPARGERPERHPELWNRVLSVSRSGEAEARAVVLGVYGVEADTLGPATWLDGVPCPDNPLRDETIPYSGRCYIGLTFERPDWCTVFVVWPRAGGAISDTSFAHELGHCASLRLGLGMDVDHTGWIWDYVDDANEALVDAGL